MFDRRHEAELKQQFTIQEVHACDDDYERLAPVDRLKGNKPNQWGLQDMLGNVWEWVEDCWHENYKDAPKDGSAWGEQEGGDCALRVVRGGSWLNEPWGVRSASRHSYAPNVPFGYVGFRLAQDI